MSQKWFVNDDAQLNAFIDFVVFQQKAGKKLVYSWTSDQQRTNRQNNAMWLWLEQIAQELNDAGYDMKKTLKPHIAIPWNKELAKQFLWNPVQEVVTGKPSSTKLSRKEINEVQEVIARHLAESTGVAVPFPKAEYDYAEET